MRKVLVIARYTKANLDRFNNQDAEELEKIKEDISSVTSSEYDGEIGKEMCRLIIVKNKKKTMVHM